MSLDSFHPQGVNNLGQSAFWRVAMGDEAAREFNYLWHQYARLENIWAALQDWTNASPEDRFVVNQKLLSFNPMMLDALWTTLLVGLAAFGDKSGHDGQRPMGIPGWLARHRSKFPPETGILRKHIREELYWGLWPIKSLRNTQLAHWDKEYIEHGGYAVHADEVTVALGQVEHSFRLIEACFAKDHLMHPPPFNHFAGMRAYIRIVGESPLGLKELF